MDIHQNARLTLRSREALVEIVRGGLLFEPAPQHIWQPRFYDFNIWSSRKRAEKLRYMHRNPVKRGLVESPELWRWSSYRAYAMSEPGAVRVNEWQVWKLKIRFPGA